MIAAVPTPVPAEDEAALCAFLALVDPDSIGPAFAALAPDRQAALVRALEARHAARMLRRGAHPELVASMRPDAVALDGLAARMAESRCWW